MNATSDLVVKQGETDLTFIQILDAPREVVFEAFSTAEHLKKWWMPAPCIMVNCTVDFRPGGEWNYTVQLPDGSQHSARSVYKEIVPNEKIEFDDFFIDENGKIIESLPSKHLTVTFDQAGEQTELVVHAQLKTAVERQKLVDMGFVQGFSTAVSQLVELIKGMQKGV